MKACISHAPFGAPCNKHYVRVMLASQKRTSMPKLPSVYPFSQCRVGVSLLFDVIGITLNASIRYEPVLRLADSH
jgi:hypothetical protein